MMILSVALVGLMSAAILFLYLRRATHPRPAEGMLVVSGRRSTLPGQPPLGYQLVDGGTLQAPLLEVVDVLSLAPVFVKLTADPAALGRLDGPPLEITATVRVDCRAPAVFRAAERLLDLSDVQRGQLAEAILKGAALRVAAAIPAGQEPSTIARAVQDSATGPLQQTGLVCETLEVE